MNPLMPLSAKDSFANDRYQCSYGANCWFGSIWFTHARTVLVKWFERNCFSGFDAQHMLFKYFTYSVRPVRAWTKATK
jgi:hypothetical protein